ncbi:MAG: MFS transporter [Asticcacaulis sp.]
MTTPFSIPAFRRYWLARCLSVLGYASQSAVLGWQVYAVARQNAGVAESALYVGLIGLAQFLAMFLLTLPAGEVADRYDRKRVAGLALAAEVILAGAFLLLAFVNSPPFWALFLLSMGLGAARAFLAPASQAIGPMIVPRELLPKAIAVNSLAFQAGAIIGPALGGTLVALSLPLAYGISLVLMLIATVLVLTLDADTRPEPQSGSRLALIKEGLVYVWRTKIIFGALSLDLAAVLLGGATALLPVFARDILHVGPDGFGLLRAAPAAGAMVTALLLARSPIRRHAGPWMFGSVAVFAGMTLVFGLSEIFWVSVFALAALGAADMVSVYVRSTLVQIVTPDAMRGRVGSVSYLFIGASNELGEFESGVAARLLGPVGAAVFGGVGALMVTGLWAWWFPSLRKVDTLG